MIFQDTQIWLSGWEECWVSNSSRISIFLIFPVLSASSGAGWHISLSTWFRDYLFLPLAYSTSRKLPKEKYLGLRTDKILYIIATSITFFLCGFWHGAAWTFIVWGLIHGLMLILEHLGLGKMLKRSYRPFQHVYMIFFLLISWVFFRSDSFQEAFRYLSIMFGSGSQTFSWSLMSDYLNTGTIVIFIIAILGSTRLFSHLTEIIKGWTRSPNKSIQAVSVHLINLGALVLMISLFALSTIFLEGETISSFIYFKF